MNESDDITFWLEQLSTESSRAMQVIWEEYFQQLVGYARRKLGSLPRRDADEEDIALSAMNSFYKRTQAGGFPQLMDRDDLWKLLLTITACKAKKRIRYNMAAKRGGGQVRGESVFGAMTDRGGLEEAAVCAPSPEFADQVVDSCEELLEQLSDPLLRKIAVMKLEGFSNDEIAGELECATRSVERKLKRIRVIWKSESDPA